MTYYEPDSGEELGKIPLKGMDVIDVSRGTTETHLLLIGCKLPRPRVYELRGKDDTERDEWILALQTAIAENS